MMSIAGTSKDALDTPALVLDLDAFDRNVARMAGTFKNAGVGWRPHTKGLKVPALAHRLIIKTSATIRDVDPGALVRELLGTIPIESRTTAPSAETRAARPA